MPFGAEGIIGVYVLQTGLKPVFKTRLFIPPSHVAVKLDIFLWSCIDRGCFSSSKEVMDNAAELHVVKIGDAGWLFDKR
jgi:hypothetical protein